MIRCALCRVDFMEKDIMRNDDLEKEIYLTKVNCKCLRKIKLSAFNKHQNECLHFKNILANLKSNFTNKKEL